MFDLTLKERYIISNLLNQYMPQTLADLLAWSFYKKGNSIEAGVFVTHCNGDLCAPKYFDWLQHYAEVSRTAMLEEDTDVITAFITWLYSKWWSCKIRRFINAEGLKEARL